MENYTKVEKKEDILNSNDIEKQQLIKKLIEVNRSLFDTLLLEFYNSDLFTKLDFDMLTYVTTIENTQKSLINFSKKEKDLFFKLINTFSREYYYPPYFASLINSFEKKEFSSFIESLPEIDSLSNEELRNISLLVTSKRNYLKISSYEEYKNFDINREIEKAKNNIDDYKNIKLISKLNVSLEEARIICSKYCYDIDKIECPENQKIIELLRVIKKVVLSNSISNIDMLLNESYPRIEYPNLQTLIQQMFVNLYNKELFTVEGKEYKENNGVKVYDAGLDFKMIVRSEGAFSSSPINWNDNVRTTYSFSNSFISNNRLNYYGLHYSGFITLGFNNLNANAIVENSVGDNATIHRRKYTLDPRSYNDLTSIPNKTTGDGCGQFFSTIDSINNFATKNIHTEITLERFYTDENNNELRVQPSYVVYYIYGENYENDELFLKSLEVAKSFNIPIVTVNVKNILLNEKIKTELKYRECLSNATIERIEELFYLYANNYVAPNQVCDEAKGIYEQIYQERQIETMLDNIIKNSKEQNKPQEFYQELFNRLMIINAPKDLISKQYLFKLYKEFNLSVDTLNLTRILEGILPSDEEPKSDFYEFDGMLEIEKKCRIYNITPTLEILSLRLYEFDNNLETLNKYDIPINEETIIINGNQIDRNIKECQRRNLDYNIDILKISNYKLLCEYLDSIMPKVKTETPILDDDSFWDEDWDPETFGANISDNDWDPETPDNQPKSFF